MPNISSHDQRRKAERRLVEQHQPRPQHQGAADRQHLLLAARERAGLLHPALPSAAENSRRRARCRAAISARSRRVIAPSCRFSSTVSRENVPRPSGTCAMPSRTMSSVARPLIALAVEADSPRGADHAGERAQRRGLAGAVGAEQRGDAAVRRPRNRAPCSACVGAVVGARGRCTSSSIGSFARSPR